MVRSRWRFFRHDPLGAFSETSQWVQVSESRKESSSITSANVIWLTSFPTLTFPSLYWRRGKEEVNKCLVVLEYSPSRACVSPSALVLITVSVWIQKEWEKGVGDPAGGWWEQTESSGVTATLPSVCLQFRRSQIIALTQLPQRVEASDPCHWPSSLLVCTTLFSSFFLSFQSCYLGRRDGL